MRSKQQKDSGTYIGSCLGQVVLAAVIALTFAASAFAQGGRTVPEPNWTRSHNYDVQHYRIEVAFDWKEKSVSGKTTITLRPFVNGLKEVELDAGEMKISAVALVLPQSTLSLKYNYDGTEVLKVALDRDYPAGRDLKLAVSYSAKPRKGISFIAPTAEDPGRPYQIWTQGEAQTNHYWFPCYDYPNDKATSETLVTVDSKYQVISNGALLGVKPDPAKKTSTWHWKMDQPYSSYLVSVIVGDFDEVKADYDGIPISSYVQKGRLSDGKVTLSRIAQMVRFYSEKTGVRYPYAKYAQTTVRDFGGGMENISATTLGDNTLHDQRAHEDLGSGNDDLQAHELAHQWFGDYLTARDWSEIWLNESFATYMANLYQESAEGREAMLYSVLQNQRQYFQTWNQGDRRPVVNNRYDDPDAVFDTYAYPRGGATLHMLRTILGDEAWWKAIGHYLKSNALKNVETPQLKIAIEEATGQNLGWFFDQWIFRMGHPELEVGYSYDDSAHKLKLTVKQNQKAPEKSVYQSVDVFRLPLEIGITTSAGEKLEKIEVNKAEQSFTFDVSEKPLIVNFDRGNAIIKTLKFPKTLEELAYQARNDKDAMGRIWAINELKGKKDSEVAASALGAVLASDSFWAARSEAAEALSGFDAKLSKTFLMAAAKDKKSAVRREALKGLARHKDASLAPLLTEIIRTDSSYYAIGEAAKALGNGGGAGAYETLSSLLEMKSDKDVVRSSALAGLANLGDKRGLDVALKYCAAPFPETVRAAGLQAALRLGKGNDAAREQIFQLLLTALRSTNTQLKVTAISSIGQFGDARAIPALEESIRNEVDLGAAAPFIKQFVAQTIAQIKARTGGK